MKLSELMTPNPIVIAPDKPAIDQLGLFEENKIHHAPVQAVGGDIVGMISSKDLNQLSHVLKTINEGGRSILVRDIMTTPVFSYYEDVDIKKAAQAMVDNHINAIIVMNSKEEMTGILTSTDLLKHLSEN